MIYKFSIIYSSLSIFIAFLRIFIINEQYTGEIFRAYVLFIIPALFFVELENLKFDLNRIKKTKNNTLNYCCLLIITIPIILILNNLNENKNNTYVCIYILICGSLVDGFINVSTANRNNNLNYLIIALRIISLQVLYLYDIYYYSLFLIIFLIILKNEISFKLFNVCNSISKENIILYLIALCGRLKEWNITFFTQIIIQNNDYYFYYYIYTKVLQNLSGLFYNYFRSNFKTNTTNTFNNFNQYIYIVYPIPIIIYIINKELLILSIPFFAFIENISAQLLVYSYIKNNRKILLINNLLCFLLLCLLYLIKLDDKLVCLYLSYIYILGIFILYKFNLKKI